MSGEGVSEGVGCDPLRDLRPNSRPGHDLLHAARVEVAFRSSPWENPSIPFPSPKCEMAIHSFYRSRTEERVPILPPLPSSNPQHTPIPIQIFWTKFHHLPDPETARIQYHEERAC
jgi:hypothetical protein